MAREQLSENQLAVLQHMSDGWHLGHSTGVSGSAWLQKRGLGRGEPTKRVHASCFHSLRQRGLIRSLGYHFPTEEYELTPKGQEKAKP